MGGRMTALALSVVTSIGRQVITLRSARTPWQPSTPDDLHRRPLPLSGRQDERKRTSRARGRRLARPPARLRRDSRSGWARFSGPLRTPPTLAAVDYFRAVSLQATHARR